MEVLEFKANFFDSKYFAQLFLMMLPLSNWSHQQSGPPIIYQSNMIIVLRKVSLSSIYW